MPKISYARANGFVFRGKDAEDKQFVFCPNPNIPFIVSEAGVTSPTPKYYISRDCCPHGVLMYIEQGKGTLEYNGTRHQLHSQDTVLLLSGSKNCYYPDPKDPFKLVWVNFFCDWMEDYVKGLGLYDNPVVSGIECSDKLHNIVRLAKTTPNNNLLCFPVLHILDDILLSLSEKVYLENHTQTASQLAIKIKDCLDSAIYEKIDIDAIAAKLFVSKSSVYRKFEKHYGETPHQYVLNRKIEFAKTLLSHEEYSIAEIANKLAFSDEFYFSNIFKKKTGISPSAFRKQRLLLSNSPPPPQNNNRRQKITTRKAGGTSFSGIALVY